MRSGSGLLVVAAFVGFGCADPSPAPGDVLRTYLLETIDGQQPPDTLDVRLPGEPDAIPFRVDLVVFVAVVSGGEALTLRLQRLADGALLEVTVPVRAVASGDSLQLRAFNSDDILFDGRLLGDTLRLHGTGGSGETALFGAQHSLRFVLTDSIP